MNKFKFGKGVAVATLMLCGTSALAQDLSYDSWKFTGSVYGWGAGIGGEAVTGADIDISFSDIIDNLDFAIMGGLKAERGPWTLFSDVVYLNMSADENADLPLGPVTIPVDVSVDMKSVIGTAGVGYQIYQQPGTKISAFGGARMLWIELEGDVSGRLLSFDGKFDSTNWDAIVGIMGETQINDKWYANYYADVGTGESNYTYQALAGLNYKLSKADLFFGYRYTKWDWDKGDFGPFSDLDTSGPYAGVKFRF